MKRIVVVGASPLLADGLRAALAGVGSDGDGDDAAWEMVAGSHPSDGDAAIVLTRSADDALALWAALPPGLPAVLLGDDLREVAARGAGDGRALGLLASGATTAQLRAALGAVLLGLSVHEPAQGNARSGAAAQRGPAGADHEPLTPREIEVFELLGKGLSNRDIGGALGISAHTAKFHVGQILAKVGAATRAEAVGTGLRLGLIGL